MTNPCCRHHLKMELKQHLPYIFCIVIIGIIYLDFSSKCSGALVSTWMNLSNLLLDISCFNRFNS